MRPNITTACVEDGSCGSCDRDKKSRSNNRFAGIETPSTALSTRQSSRRHDSIPMPQFVWKEGPAPPPLPGRPSLGLIPSGQVRILAKQLVIASPSVAAGVHAQSGGGGSADFRHILADSTFTTLETPDVGSVSVLRKIQSGAILSTLLALHH